MSTSDDPAGRLSEDQTAASRQVNHQILLPAFDPPSYPSNVQPPRKGHRRLVFPDPVAFRYLEEDPATVVLERRRRLQGYETYVVEQWACSRIHPTFVIATYTGDATHSILVAVLSIPNDESTWSSRLKVYFKAISEYHAREKETPLGTLMVTNLSGFPSALTVIPVPDGDIRKHREDFLVNENLKRLGCAGRAGLNLQTPQSSTIAKFHHLYRTSQTVPLYTSVVELVKLCQLSLTLYGKLAPAYADGLLCDVTEKAVNDWWSDIGAYVYNIEPNDGILGPATVTALVGLLMGAYNRMKAFGAPVGKDVFDIDSTKTAISHFQKSQRMDRTRRLDRQTLMKLRKVTAKTASGEGWTVPKAVKSTVAELSGKGGEMVMGIVGGRDKVGIAEVETLDIERLAELVTGTKARWLWQGKAVRSGESDTFGPFGTSGNDKIFSADDQGNYMWTGKHRGSLWSDTSLRKSENPDDSENRSGFGRFKDAVSLPGLRSHQHRHSREELRTDVESHDRRDERALTPIPGKRDSITKAKEALSPLQKTTSKIPASNVDSQVDYDLSQTSLRSESAHSRQLSEDIEPEPTRTADYPNPIFQTQTNTSQIVEEVRRKLSSYEYKDLFPNDDHPDAPQALGLKRTQSFVKPTVNITPSNPRINRLPRSLSFSAIEPVILTWDDPTDTTTNNSNHHSQPQDSQSQPTLYKLLLATQATTHLTLTKSTHLTHLELTTIPFINLQLTHLTTLDKQSQSRLDTLKATYYDRLAAFQTAKATAADVLIEERGALLGGGDAAVGMRFGVGKMEGLAAKLDYEIEGLRGRVEEVEAGVAEFEGMVGGLEGRVGVLVGRFGAGTGTGTVWEGEKMGMEEIGNGKGMEMEESGQKEKGRGREREGWGMFLKRMVWGRNV